MRVTGTNFLNALSRKVVQTYEMCFLDMGPTGGTLGVDRGVWLTNAPMDIEFEGNTYVGVGGFLGFSEIVEEQEFGVKEVTVSLAGLPMYDLKDEGGNSHNFFAEFLEHDYIDRKVKIYRAFFNDDQLITEANGTPAIVMMFDGRIDYPTIQDAPDKTTTIAVRVANNWIDFERTNGRRTNDNEQRALTKLMYGAEDIGFEFVSETLKDIQWVEDADAQ